MAEPLRSERATKLLKDEINPQPETFPGEGVGNSSTLSFNQNRIGDKPMPKVTLISYTGHGHPDPLYAAKLLAYTKSTRLNMTPEGFDDFMDKSVGEIKSELDYMANTIPSSWEMVDLIFSIQKVSRATAQQITRTRNASFAMQSQRVSDMSEVGWDLQQAKSAVGAVFDDMMSEGIHNYSSLVERGMPLEDARDLLPIGVHCNIIAKYNLRALVELVSARQSIRVQGPYRDVTAQMKAETLRVWPWAEVFFKHPYDKALALIEEVARGLAEAGAVYKGPAGNLAKAIDLLKKA